MSGFELRPLSLGELLDRAFLLYRRNFGLFVGIMVIPTVLMLPLQIMFLRGQDAPFPWRQPSPQSHVVAYSYAILLVYLFLYAVVQAATTYAVSDAYLGHPATVREAYGKVRGHYWRVMGVTLGMGLRAFGWVLLFVFPALIVVIILSAAMSKGGAPPGGAFLALVPLAIVLAGSGVAVWICVRYAVSIPAVLLENIKGRAAIRRSVELSRGRRGQGFIAILLALVVTYAMVLLFQGPFYALFALLKLKGPLPIGLVLGMTTSSAIGGVIAGPLLMIILVLFYYDLRIRKEAFDLQQMMASLPDSNPVGPASLT